MLDIIGISKTYKGFNLADITFNVGQGDYCVILGPSGAGKTVLLEILAGMIAPDRGKIVFGGTDITGNRIQDRPFGMVFQDYAVFPHMKVRQNIGYPLKARGKTRARDWSKVDRIASVCGIAHLLERYPSKLSGGELQRVALARTLLSEPKYLLLDEPLASLDIPLRAELQGLLRKLNREGQTIIHVTHDFDEALILATKVVVISEGRVIQTGSPKEIFHHPTSAFMARFTGVKNYFEAVLTELEGKSFAKTARGLAFRVMTDARTGTKGFVLIRGEDVFISQEKTETSATNQFQGIVRDISLAIRGYEILVEADGHEFYINTTEESPANLGLTVGTTAWISFKASATRFIPVD